MNEVDKRVLTIMKSLTKLAKKNQISRIKVENMGEIEFFKPEVQIREVPISVPLDKDDPRAKMPSDEEMLLHSTGVRFESIPEVE
jgi:hypothetical protein